MASWDRIQELFLAAADLPEHEQDRFLREACGGDAELRAEVESLLESDRRVTGEIDQAVKHEAGLFFDAGSLTGQRLGAYRIVRGIGRGGMGAVYLATRDDRQFDKMVAIKVVKRGMDTAEVLHRFRGERQILARLDHPYIARLLDGGTSPDGRPYFVIEYVPGQSIDVYCRERKLSIKERCILFLKVCEAVAYAHRNLVVHRDLKPANILITAEGVPKLLDFGVAKLLDPDTGEGITQTAAPRPLTPEYASPEQVAGAPVNTVTDVYALGAVLYELLTGQRAHRFTTRTPAEVHKIVCETDIAAPSAIAPEVDRDLDTIVLKAMRKDADRRYSSVEELAQDIGRFLRHEPVLARNDSFGYRARKFLVRHRLQVAAAALVFVGLIAAVILFRAEARQAVLARRAAELQRAEAERERANAERERAIAEAARASAIQEHETAEQQRARAEQRLSQLLELSDRTLFDVHSAIRNLPGAMQARKDIITTTLNYLEKLEKDEGIDDRLRIAIGAAYLKLSDYQANPYMPNVGDIQGGLESLRRAEALLGPVFRRRPNEVEVVGGWVRLMRSRASVLRAAGREQEAIRVLEQALPVAHQLAGLDPNTLDSIRQEPGIHAALSALFRPRDIRRSALHGEQELALDRAALARFSENLSLKHDLAGSYAQQAGTLGRLGSLRDAADLYERSIALREELLAKAPQDVEIRRGLVITYGNYAAMLGVPWEVNLHQYDKARQLAAKAVDLARDLVKENPGDAGARFDLASILLRLGSIPVSGAEGRASLAALEESRALLDRLQQAAPQSTRYRETAALAEENIGRALENLGDFAAAETHYVRSLALIEQVVAADPQKGSAVSQLLASEQALARIYALRGNWKDALAYADRAFARAGTLGTNPPDEDLHHGRVGRAWFTRAVVYRAMGDADRARESASAALEEWRKVKNPVLRDFYGASWADAESISAQR